MDLFLVSFLAAVAIDAAVGDPQVRFHPVRLIGRTASFFEALFRRRIGGERVAGIAAWWAVIATVITAGGGVLLVAGALGDVAWGAAAALGVYASFAARDLARHATAAARALEAGDIAEARKRTGYMVSRDVAGLGEEALIRAVVESTAENIVDSITAPLMFAALLGPLGAVFYRAANTMDAMFGYRNERYINFGRFAARADDLLTWVPARLTGPLFCLSAGLLGGDYRSAWRVMKRDARKHHSPNGGIVESAAAGALGIRLGGPGAYFGKTVDKPYLGDHRREPRVSDIRRTVLMMYGTLLFTAALGALIITARSALCFP